jgi:phage-related protein
MLIPLVVGVMGMLTAAFIASTIAAMAFSTALTGGIVLAVIVMAAVIIRYHEAIWKFIQKVWHDIKAWAMDAFNWVKDNWPLILGILTGPIGLAVVEIVKHWHEIVDGLKSIWGDITGFFRRLPGDILNALGDLGKLLWNAGVKIIDGLINGIKSHLGFLGSILGGIGGFIAAHKGPLEVDAQLLVPHGKAIMGGLMTGIGSQMPALGTQLSRVTSGIGGIGGGIGGIAGLQVSMAPGTGNQFERLLLQSIRLLVLKNGGGGPGSVQRAFGQVH